MPSSTKLVWKTADKDSSNSVCSLCSRMVQGSRIIDLYTHDNRLLLGDIQEELYTFYEGLLLEVSAQNGCHLCSLLWNCLDEQSWKRMRIDIVQDQTLSQKIKFQVLVERPGQNVHLRLVCTELNTTTLLYLGPGTVEAGMWRCSRSLFARDSRDNDPVYSPPSPWHLYSSTRSEAVLSLARQWLRRCLATHSQCSLGVAEVNGRPEMPTRLLDVGRGDDIVRLCASSLYGSERPEYICLSHVWGNAKVYRLTRDTIGDLNSGIGVTQLPETFQDAIYMTKFLGYRYIWIDSLCIIQDSREDWAKEASRMAMVYGNATCTIAAIQQDGQSGCFVNRNPLSLRPCRLLSDRKIYAYTTSGTASLRSSPLSSTLFRRAWTFQERILSRRTIYLGTDELWWECSTMAANEPYVDGYRHLQIQSLCRHDSFFHSSQENRDFRNITQSRANDFVRNNVDDTVARRWHEIVRQYSMRLLTYDTDKLIAIHGVAVAFQPSIGPTRAGLIEEKMITELSWYVDTEAATLTDASFPSWSWASVKGEIRFRAWSLSKGFAQQAQYISCDPDQPANASNSTKSQKLVL